VRLPAIAFFDELSKIAAKVPVQHASAELKKVLRARTGPATSKVDPNDARLYVAMKNRRNKPGTITFGKQQRDRFAGGQGPVYLHNAKVDTKKGWRPRLTPKAKDQGYSIDDLHEMATSLDDPKSTKKSRGPIWKKLQHLTGTWINVDDPSASAKAIKARPVKV
jgi:hypothetical protein